jgi:ADP-heptose:LPS heptosyltransferase
LSDLAENERYYVIFPGAGYVARQWSPERFGALANLIYARTGWRGVICGASSDKRIAQVIVSDSPSPLVDWTGRTTLGELASVLIRSQLLVTNDTSAVHIAAAVGTPSICVLGGGQFGQFLPYAVDAASQTTLPRVAYHPMDCFGCNWQCKFPVGKYRPKPCVERVEVDQVLDQVKIILNRSPAKQEARFPLLKAISP